MRRCTDVTMVLDRSGSMGGCKKAMEEALNAYVADLKLLTDECVFSLMTFDDRYAIEVFAKPVKNVPEIVIKPRGSTALLDAIGRTIDDVGRRLGGMPEDQRPDKVMIVIVTDGYENASVIYNKQTVFEKLSHQRDVYSWTFLFIGADQDAIATAASYGISRGNAMNFSGAPGALGAPGATGPQGAAHIGKAMSLATKKMSDGFEKTSGDLLAACANPDEVNKEYDAAYAGRGNIKDPPKAAPVPAK